MKSINIVQMDNGFLVQVAKQPGTVIKSLVFDGDNIRTMLDAIYKELTMAEPPVLTVAGADQP